MIRSPLDATATARVRGVAQVFELHAIASDRRVRKMLFMLEGTSGTSVRSGA
jgi:hypothetical protein